MGTAKGFQKNAPLIIAVDYQCLDAVKYSPAPRKRCTVDSLVKAYGVLLDASFVQANPNWALPKHSASDYVLLVTDTHWFFGVVCAREDIHIPMGIAHDDTTTASQQYGSLLDAIRLTARQSSWQEEEREQWLHHLRYLKPSLMVFAHPPAKASEM